MSDLKDGGDPTPNPADPMATLPSLSPKPKSATKPAEPLKVPMTTLIGTALLCLLVAGLVGNWIGRANVSNKASGDAGQEVAQEDGKQAPVAAAPVDVSKNGPVTIDQLPLSEHNQVYGAYAKGPDGDPCRYYLHTVGPKGKHTVHCLKLGPDDPQTLPDHFYVIEVAGQRKIVVEHEHQRKEAADPAIKAEQPKKETSK
ncbi:hypothetical protein COU77_00535 [Candidatus Peregrinibacteria bacterium CG10_big_fil_rev_8_21_14_0_10_49_16]|nr:MAG: hypothetical protein COW95_01685 [Candidatus Peregrinibacteria bacterium CG22_combo_CG10-13_8_21_14_all_49_11]PIR52384.1 MAG: hypothetical protein COU77_00535 [Candidatus Peregrinibacteria bacterium CG10_big_fil_rev_8_21_14_0_10_49_16]